jgi:competence protein ComEC
MEIERDTQPVSRSSLYILMFLWSSVSGVLVSSFVSISPLFSIFLIALSGAIFVGEKIHNKSISKEVICMILVLFAFGIGAFRYAVKDFHEVLLPSKEGTVVSEPEHRDADTRFVFKADNSEKVLVSTEMYSHVAYGDRVSVQGKLEEPGPILEDTGRTFDYGAYLSKDDIYYTTSLAKVQIISTGNGNKLAAGLFKIKNSFTDKMKEILPEPESSLLAGLIVAGKQGLPKAILDEFKSAGVVHIVVLSGYNITVIAEFFLLLLAFLPLKRRMIVAALAIILFVIMTGATATVVRAAIMAMVVLLGKVIHRQYSASRTLLLAAVIMLFINPKILVFDPSFQLTFLAMLALIYVEPLVSAKLDKMVLIATSPMHVREQAIPSWITSLLSTTIATQLTVLPYLLYSVGSVSIVSLVSNICILVFVPFTMLVGFIATTVAFISPILAWPATFVTHLLLAWILGVAHVLGNLSWASIKISHFNLWLTLVCYVVMIFIVMRSRNSLQHSAS